jgi:predicted DNA-binding transcriptional regulator AlpA
MLSIIRNLLQDKINDIDAGNSNISEEDGLKVISILNELSRRDEGISKYDACVYLNISRATFDNKVREGELPRGKHVRGFKELRWYKKDLDKFIKEAKNGNKKEINHSNI